MKKVKKEKLKYIKIKNKKKKKYSFPEIVSPYIYRYPIPTYFRYIKLIVVYNAFKIK